MQRKAFQADISAFRTDEACRGENWLGKYLVRRMGIFAGVLLKHMKSLVSPYEGPELLGKLLLLVDSMN